jgi:plasmid stabilization system protein ParE
LADYISADSPNNAEIVGERILAATESLLERPHMGREGRRSGTREWPVRRTPYILIYSV